MKSDSPAVIMRPPHLYPDALGLGLVLDYFKPASWLPMTVKYPVGLALIAAGIAPVVSAIGRLKTPTAAVPTSLPGAEEDRT